MDFYLWVWTFPITLDLSTQNRSLYLSTQIIPRQITLSTQNQRVSEYSLSSMSHSVRAEKLGSIFSSKLHEDFQL